MKSNHVRGFELKYLAVMSVLLCVAILAPRGPARSEWSPPPANPPESNAAAPLNVSGNAQTKQGNLSLGGDFLKMDLGSVYLANPFETDSPGIFWADGAIAAKPHMNFLDPKLYISAGDTEGNQIELQGMVNVVPAGALNPAGLRVQSLVDCSSLKTTPDGTLACGAAAASGYWTQTGMSLYPTNPLSNVMIGTTTPTPLTKLLVEGQPGDRGQLVVSNPGGPANIGIEAPADQESALTLNQGTNPTWTIYRPGGSTNLQFYNNTTDEDRVTFQANGNVGIGDTTPASLLTVGNNDLFQVDSAGNIIKLNGVTYSWPDAQGADGTYLKSDAAGNLTWNPVVGGSGSSQWLDNGTSIHYDAGNVGVGTADPTTALEVTSGPIKATGGFIIETRDADPPNTERPNGRMWLLN